VVAGDLREPTLARHALSAGPRASRALV
jgi:hypothetical protein